MRLSFLLPRVDVHSPFSPLGSHSSYTSTSEFQSAVAQFFYAFFITVFLFIVAAHRSSGGLIFALCLIDLALLFIGLCAFFPLPLSSCKLTMSFADYSYPDNIKLLRAGGGFGIIAAWCVSPLPLLPLPADTLRHLAASRGMPL